MSFNGSGTFNINTAGQPVVTGTVISSSVFNSLTADLATGLSTCITKDGQTTVTANIPMNSFKFTGLAAGTAATDSVRLGQLQAGAATLITVTGTNTYAGTMTPALSAYAAGNTFTFLVPNTNTTSCTLNIDGLGAKSITRDGTTALVAGDLVANSEVVVVYDGTQFQVLNSNSKTNFNLSGTLTVAGNTTLSGGTANQVQYLNASKVLSGSANLTFDGTTLTANALTTSSTVTINGGTANGVAYLNGSKVLTTGSALTFDGSTFKVTTGAGGISAFFTDATYSSLKIDHSDTGGLVKFLNGANQSMMGLSSSYLNFYANNAEQMRLTSTGLGIGTSSPSARLSVDSGATQQYANFNSSAAAGGFLTLTRSGANSIIIGNYLAASGGGGTISADALFLRTANGIGFGPGGAGVAAFFDTSGNLGIGTSSPGYKLDVNGSINIAAGTFFRCGSNPLVASNGSTLNYQYAGTTALAWRNQADTTELMRLDSSGNLGLGVTPSASTIAQFEGGANLILVGRGNVYASNNATFNSGWKYISTAVAAQYNISNAEHRWYNAPSGTAGNAISFTQAMTLDSSGNLGIGETSPAERLHLTKSGGLSKIRLDGTASSATNFLIGQGITGVSNGGLEFRDVTNSATRACIDSSGNLLVGTTTSAMTAGGVRLKNGGGNLGEIALANNSGVSDYVARFLWGSAPTLVGNITVSSTATAFNTSSDQRLKENITDADSASDLIDAIKVRQFDWKSDGSHQRYGMIAQELYEAAPEAVHVPADPEDMMSVDYSKLVPMLIKEIQSLRQRVAQLEVK